jgi:hypothetical protein
MPKSDTTPDPEVVREILETLENLRYGSVEIIVQDGKVVQIERKEKRRPKNHKEQTSLD